jgi:hypothetical protein
MVGNWFLIFNRPVILIVIIWMKIPLSVDRCHDRQLVAEDPVNYPISSAAARAVPRILGTTARTTPQVAH